jgi:hypothetical protein
MKLSEENLELRNELESVRMGFEGSCSLKVTKPLQDIRRRLTTRQP